MSEKLDAIERLFNLVWKLVYPPREQEENNVSARLRAATEVVSSLADVAIKLQAQENAIKTLAHNQLRLEASLKRVLAVTLVLWLATLSLIIITDIIGVP